MKIEIASLNETDIPRAMELVLLAGWNQTQADWMRFLEREPAGCFKALSAGQLVGTVTSISYSTQLAWIGMMLVHPAARRQGIGRRLMESVLAYLQELGVQSIKLDATPLGQPLYAQLGFRTAERWQRWQRDSQQPLHSQTPLAADSERRQLDETLRELDLQAFGVDRWNWLQGLSPASRLEANSAGYAMLRAGRVASYLGPVVARDASAAEPLIRRLLNGMGHHCIWDVPAGNPPAEAIAKDLGFEPVRLLYRMWLHHQGPDCSLHNQFAFGDPATG